MKRALSSKTNRKRRAQSSWVHSYGYATLTDRREGLVVSFEGAVGGAIYFYDSAAGYDETIWQEMDAAPSKGQFVWSVLMPLPHGSNTNYEEVTF